MISEKLPLYEILNTPLVFHSCPIYLLYVNTHSFFQIRKTELLRISSSSDTRPRWRSECHTVASLSIIVAAFMISWIPLYLINTLLHFLPTSCIPMWVIDLSIALSHMNSVWNPIVYALGMKDFKHAFKRLTTRESRRVSDLDRGVSDLDRGVSDPDRRVSDQDDS